MPVRLFCWHPLQRNQPPTIDVPPVINSRSLCRLWLLALIVPCLMLGAEPPAETLPAQSTAVAPPVESATAPAAQPPKPVPTPEQKRKVIVLTSLMMLGILAVLLFLFLWILWWSRRTHRMLRQPLPSANRGDELWYLKGKGTPPQNAERKPVDRPPAPPPA